MSVVKLSLFSVQNYSLVEPKLRTDIRTNRPTQTYHTNWRSVKSKKTLYLKRVGCPLVVLLTLVAQSRIFGINDYYGFTCKIQISLPITLINLSKNTKTRIDIGNLELGTCIFRELFMDNLFNCLFVYLLLHNKGRDLRKRTLSFKFKQFIVVTFLQP